MSFEATISNDYFEVPADFEFSVSGDIYMQRLPDNFTLYRNDDNQVMERNR